MKPICTLLLLVLCGGFSNPRQCIAQLGRLTLTWAGTISNGEGDGDHGPLGSLHILIYPSLLECPGKARSYSGYLRHVYLPGPSSGEWLDGDAMRMNLDLFEWRHENDAVTVFVYESDPSAGFGWLSGRAHDPVFCLTVTRAQSLTPLVLGGVGHPAPKDARQNCVRDGVSWHKEVWSGGISPGIPSMFMRFETKGVSERHLRSEPPTASIDRVWVTWDVFQGGVKGMLIHCQFAVNNLDGSSCTAIAYFNYAGGGSLRDFDGQYRTTGGDVSVGERFTPQYVGASFSDFRLFMPYDQLHMAPGRHELELTVSIFDSLGEGAQELARSEAVGFRITR